MIIVHYRFGYWAQRQYRCSAGVEVNTEEKRVSRGEVYVLRLRLINQFLEGKKYTRTAKAGSLNGLRSAKKTREEFTGIEEGFN